MVQQDGSSFLIVVCEASWSALYDLRADVETTLGQSESSEAPNTKITIEYRASIVQTTGEDWKGVSLTLSTASPNLGSEIPELAPWNIGPLRTARMYSDKAVMSARSARSTGLVRWKRQARENVETFQTVIRNTARKVNVTEGGISSSYEIGGLSTIPSDESEHKVTIAVRALVVCHPWH